MSRGATVGAAAVSYRAARVRSRLRGDFRGVGRDGLCSVFMNGFLW